MCEVQSLNTCMEFNVPKFMFLGPTVLATEAVTHTHTQNSVEYNIDV